MEIRTIIAAGALAFAPIAASAAIITDGNVILGVNDIGSLNDFDGTEYVGLTYAPTGYEATAPGCLCEGWGVGVADAGGTAVATGYTTEAQGTSNLEVVSFVSDGATATSVVNMTSGGLQVTHDFALAAESNELYEVKVTITNTSDATIDDVRYTRVMDWDTEPTAFSEFVTIQGTAAATNVLYAGDDGFVNGDPFGLRSPIVPGAEGDFVDSGPDDHGAVFDFSFGALAAGESVTFEIYYGGARTETEAIAALNAVGAEVYSLGQVDFDPEGTGADGTNTFIFGFSGVGGTVVPPPTIPVPASALLLMGALGMLGAVRRRRA